ncbi:MAG: hypothetical protein M3R70_10615 [Actinomycetota bacterium]|nr:hypothetical protein [Actinomycetota bacterium]
MRRTIVLLLTALATLALIPAAAAKGDAKIQVSPVPKNLKPGKPWNATLTLLIEGNSPWDITGVAPALQLRNPKTGKTEIFYGRQTSRTGVYRAKVVFPSKAKYELTAWVDSNNPQFPSNRFEVAVGAAASDGTGWVLPLLGALALAGAAGLTAILIVRIRRRTEGLAPAEQS